MHFYDMEAHQISGKISECKLNVALSFQAVTPISAWYVIRMIVQLSTSIKPPYLHR